MPQDVAGDVCDYPLARNLILLMVAVASELLVRFVLTGNRENLSVTLRDLAIRPLECSRRRPVAIDKARRFAILSVTDGV